MTNPVAIRDRIRELRRVSARELVANPKNWRKHPLSQQKAMRAVLGEIGFADALLARQDENGRLILIDGHLRAEISPDTDVPVLILDVTENEADKILATLDPLASMAELDMDAFGKLADGIEFDVPEFGQLLQELKSPSSQAIDGEDDIPDVPAIPVTQPGDLWLLGRHRLLCADATLSADVARLLAGVQPGLMVTDAPYGVSYEPAWRNEAARKGKISYAARREGKVANDDRVDWTAAYKLFPGSVLYLWHASLFGSQVQTSIERVGFELRSQIIWAKSRFAISRGHYHWQHECCFYAVRKGSNGNWQGDRSQTTLWTVASCSNEEDKNDHGTQKPVELMRRPVLNHTNPGQSVYDPFVGSGTTLIAAETTGRSCFAIDIEAAYVDVVITRWQNLTGEHATLDGDGQTFTEISNVRRSGD
jgi:DNA modification methylase